VLNEPLGQERGVKQTPMQPNGKSIQTPSQTTPSLPGPIGDLLGYDDKRRIYKTNKCLYEI